MPKTYLDENDFDQDWEPVVLSGGKCGPVNRTESTFGSRLIEARRLAQETQHSVAQSVGVPLATVEAWETNETAPTKSQLIRLNRILRCDKKLK